MKKSIKTIIAIFVMTLGLGGAFAMSTVNGGMNKVEETQAAADGYLYVRCTRPTGWGDTLKCYYWGSSTETCAAWPGQGATTTYNNLMGQTIFVFEIPTDVTGLQFNNGNWKTDDLTLNSTGNSWYLGTNIWQDSSDYGTWTPNTYEMKVYDAHNILSGNVYLYAFRGSSVNSGHVKMSKQNLTHLSDYFYTIQVDELYSNIIVTNGSWDKKTDDLSPDSSKYFVIESFSTKLVGGYYDNTDYVYAMDWVNHEMHIEDIPTSSTGDTNKCRDSGSGYYRKAKNAYLNYSGIKSNLEYVTDSDKAIERFSAWARANGESASFDGSYNLTISGRSYSFVIDTIGGIENNVAVIASIMAMAIAIGGYFLLRKKRI